jgi:dienelactone hydrolase
VAEPRIAAILPSQGANTVAGIVSSLRSNIKGDHTILHNCYLRDYQEYWALIAPRHLLHQHGRKDGMNSQAPVIMEYLSSVYHALGKEKNASLQIFAQGHEDTEDLRRASYLWFDRVLRDGSGKERFKDVTSENAGRILQKVDLSLPSITRRDSESRRTHPRIDYEAVFAREAPTHRIDGPDTYAKFRAEMSAVLRSKILKCLCRRGETAYDRDMSVLKLEDGLLRRRMVFHPAEGQATPAVVLLDMPTEGADFPTAEAKQFTARANKAGFSVAVLEPTGGDGLPDPDGPEATGRQWKHPNLHRLAVIVGHTLCSLRIQDALAAVAQLRELEGVDPKRIYVSGRGMLAVPALYAGIVDQDVAGVLLLDPPESHTREEAAETGLLLFLLHGDLAQAAGLIYPRKCAVVRAELGRWNWTRQLYETLGKPEQFVHMGPMCPFPLP